jgi:putative Holliday junction resolvase
MPETMTNREAAQPASRDRRGRVMALDMGEKRIGVAISDEGRTIARSLVTLRRRSRLEDFERIARIAKENGVNLLVVGLPVRDADREGQKAAWVRDYSSALQRHLATDLLLWDESYSTVQAEASLRERGVHGKRRRQRVDAAAAAFILQSYLDAQSTGDFGDAEA